MWHTYKSFNTLLRSKIVVVVNVESILCTCVDYRKIAHLELGHVMSTLYSTWDNKQKIWFPNRSQRITFTHWATRRLEVAPNLPGSLWHMACILQPMLVTSWVHFNLISFSFPPFQLEARQVSPPFKPRIEDQYGLGNFDPQFTNEPVVLTPDDP